MTSPAPRHDLPELDATAFDDLLAARVRAGDVAAFESLFTTHYASLCGFVVSYVRSEAVAEDLVADLFRHIWGRRERWMPKKGIATYLFGAARNRALDYLKHERIERRVRRDLVLSVHRASMGAPPARADERVVAEELDIAIQRAIKALPPRRRLAFTLRRQQCMSYAQIAEVMGTSVKTVEIQIGLALKSLRSSLADWIA
jgi:RNA polymerase sigma-70 factor (ECF subfamily)